MNLQARQVLSPGGFTNRLLLLDDGERRLRVKVVDPERVEDLVPWVRHHERLTQDHGAPRLLEQIPHDGGLALILEDIPGRRLHVGARSAATAATLAVAAGLHHDRELTEALGPARTCAEAAVGLYVRRLRDDLVGPMPEFLDPDWAAEEVDALEREIRDDAAFAVPAAAAVHGDFCAANIIVTPRGEIRILDWDDLHGGGDPALDLTSLLFPLLLQGRGGNLLAAYGDAGVLERTSLYFRALVLQEVIDTLSDYSATERTDVRARKLLAHRTALALYRDMRRDVARRAWT